MQMIKKVLSFVLRLTLVDTTLFIATFIEEAMFNIKQALLPLAVNQYNKMDSIANIKATINKDIRKIKEDIQVTVSELKEAYPTEEEV